MFEYCFIDCPAGVGMEFELAASICESAIIIATSDAVSLRDAQRVNLLLVDRNITDAKLILNRFSPKLLKKTSVKNIDNAIDNVGSRLLGIVPEDPVVLECQGNSLPVILHEKRGASRAYFNIANRILGKRVELLEKV